MERRQGTKGVENFLSIAGHNAINPPPGSALRKPLINPLETLKTVSRHPPLQPDVSLVFIDPASGSYCLFDC